MENEGRGQDNDMYGKLRMSQPQMDSSSDDDSCGGVKIKDAILAESSSEDEVVVFKRVKFRERDTRDELVSHLAALTSTTAESEDEKPSPLQQAEPQTTSPRPPTITRRPLSEPPQFNYIAFARRIIPSDRRFKVLFPDNIHDIENRTSAKDLLIEHELLDWFHAWTRLETIQMKNDVRNRAARFEEEPVVHGPSDAERTEFLAGLKKELAYDNKTVKAELEEVYSRSIDRLAKWEFKYLDNDGDTKRIQNLMDDRSDRNHDIFRGCKEARRKYGYLCERPLEQWERKFLHKADEGTTIIRERLEEGDDIFVGCEEARKKYECVLNPTLEQWEGLNLDEYGGDSLIRERLLNGRDVFIGCEASKAKYGRLIPTELEKWEHVFLDHERSFKSYALSCGFNLDDYMFRNCLEAKSVYGWIIRPNLEQWENLYLDADGATTWIQEQLLDEKPVFHACDEAAPKYAHMTPTRLESWEYKNIFRFSGVTTGLENYMRDGENVFEFCEKARMKYQDLAPPGYKWSREVDQLRLEKEEAEERKIFEKRREYAAKTGVVVDPLVDISAPPTYLGSDFDTSSDESGSMSSTVDSEDSYHTARRSSTGETSGLVDQQAAGRDVTDGRHRCIVI